MFVRLRARGARVCVCICNKNPISSRPGQRAPGGPAILRHQSQRSKKGAAPLRNDAVPPPKPPPACVCVCEARQSPVAAPASRCTPRNLHSLAGPSETPLQSRSPAAVPKRTCGSMDGGNVRGSTWAVPCLHFRPAGHEQGRLHRELRYSIWRAGAAGADNASWLWRAQRRRGAPPHLTFTGGKRFVAEYPPQCGGVWGDKHAAGAPRVRSTFENTQNHAVSGWNLFQVLRIIGEISGAIVVGGGASPAALLPRGPGRGQRRCTALTAMQCTQ
jgi:hypothetical protein